MSTYVKIYRETALPSVLEPGAIYLIANPSKPDYYEQYVVNKEGTKAKRMFGEEDVTRKLAELAASRGQLVIVDNIAKRNALTGIAPGSEAFVKDATGDSTVSKGGAKYLWDGSTWIKVSETESMDLVLTWEGIQDKPTSSVQAIDAAVRQSHTHNNKTQLDKIGENEGNLTYDGKPVKTQFESVGW